MLGGGFRPHQLKAFIPLSEDFHKRQQQCHRVVLADVIGQASLGHFPQGTIASDLALCFGGLSTDFLVAAFHERDYVIMLPQWVRPDTLINNGLITLSHCQLRCVPWDPLRYATPSFLTYKAWIRLVNLPFECWSAHKVSTIVCGFGRFIKADDNSSNMVDMMWYRCLIAVDDLADIPEHLAITLGDVTVTVLVQIDNTAPFGGDDRGIPFTVATLAKAATRRTPWGGVSDAGSPPPSLAAARAPPEKATATTPTPPGTPQKLGTGGMPHPSKSAGVAGRRSFRGPRLHRVHTCRTHRSLRWTAPVSGSPRWLFLATFRIRFWARLTSRVPRGRFSWRLCRAAWGSAPCMLAVWFWGPRGRHP